MLLRGLHPACGDRPQPLGEIEFIPSSADDLASPGGGDNREFQRPRRDAVFAPQGDHKFGELHIRKRGVMLYSTDLAASRKEVFKMAAPPRRVLAAPIAARGGPIENRLYPTAHAACGFGFGRPDWLNGLQDHADVNGVDCEIAKMREYV